MTTPRIPLVVCETCEGTGTVIFKGQPYICQTCSGHGVIVGGE